jgi:hypothetical protein
MRMSPVREAHLTAGSQIEDQPANSPTKHDVPIAFDAST